MADRIESRYTDADLDRWAGQEDASINTAANQLRHAAGITSDVRLGADDQTIRETIEEQEDLLTTKGAVQGGAGAAELAALAFEGAAAGAVLELGAAAGEVFVFGKELIDAEQRGQAVERDNTRAAMLADLDLPQSYKDGVMNRITSKYTDGQKSGAQKMGEAGRTTVEGRQAMALAQIHADQGANAAVMMINAGIDRAALLKTHPNVAMKYATDPAFRMGFDAMQYAHEKNPAEYKKAVDDLLARDVRYHNHNVQVWV